MMKQQFYINLFILLCAISLKSQNWYSGFGLGYSLGAVPQNITSHVTIDQSQSSYETVKGSFGKGLNANGYLGYWLQDKIGLELGLSYLESGHFNGSYTKDTVFKQSVSVSARMLRVLPAIRAWLHKGEKKNGVYLKLGTAIRIIGNITSETRYVDIQNNTTTLSEMKFSKGFSSGFTGGVGFTHQMTTRLSLFGELTFISQSWAPKNGDMTEYSVNGVDQMDVLFPRQKHIHFKDNYVTPNTSLSNYKPNEQLKQYHNFSSIGLSIGIQFALMNKKE